MQLKVGYATDIGKKRSQNQDNFGAYLDLGLFIVADGMGGHRGGEIASAMAVETITNLVRQAENAAKGSWIPRTVLTEAIHSANNAIYERSLSQAQLQGMGTTTTALLFKDNVLTIGHVGDSRCYFFRPTAVWQVTRDHSLVQEKLRAGLITRAELKTDRMKNVITRSVGFEPDVTVEIYEMATQPGDIFLICSDGLSGLIDDSKLLELVQTHLLEGNDIKNAVTRLVEAANQAGGDDNITCVLIEVEK